MVCGWADGYKLPVSSRKGPCAFVFSLPLSAAADHPSPGGRHPGDTQLPGLRLPGDGGRLQHGRALPSTVVSSHLQHASQVERRGRLLGKHHP